MPMTKFQGITFGAMMSVMDYGIKLYNVARKMGGMSNSVFLPALIEKSYMCLFVFAISSLFGNKISQQLAFTYQMKTMYLKEKMWYNFLKKRSNMWQLLHSLEIMGSLES